MALSLRVRHPNSYKYRLVMERNSFEEYFDSYNIENADLDMESKAIALAASQFVVGLSYWKGEDMLFACSGIISESQQIGSGYLSTVVTSAIPLRSTHEDSTIASDLEVFVHLPGSTCHGEVIAFDFHYNIALIKISTEEPQEVATLRPVDDSSLDELGPVDSRLFKLSSGEKLIALGRHYRSRKLMAATGVFSKRSCSMHCEELCRATCKISLNGIGGPLINVYGEVIGLNFYHEGFTPFLPSNILSICLNCLKNDRIVPHPWLGIHAVNLISGHVSIVEKVFRRFFNIRKGVLIEKVVSGSPAAVAGIHPYDVIILCGGRSVTCIEFFQAMLENVDKEIELIVMRVHTGECLNLKLAVGDASHGGSVRWPVPKKRRIAFTI